MVQVNTPKRYRKSRLVSEMPGLFLFVQKHRDQKRNQQGGDFAGALDEYRRMPYISLARQRV